MNLAFQSAAILTILSLASSAAAAGDPPDVAWIHNLYQCGNTTSAGNQRQLAQEEYLSGVDLTKSTTIKYGFSSFPIELAYDKAHQLVGSSDAGYGNGDSLRPLLTVAHSAGPPTPVAFSDQSHAQTRSGLHVGSTMSDVIKRLGTTGEAAGTCGGRHYRVASYANPGCGNLTTFTSVDGIVARIDYTGISC